VAAALLLLLPFLLVAAAAEWPGHMHKFQQATLGELNHFVIGKYKQFVASDWGETDEHSCCFVEKNNASACHSCSTSFQHHATVCSRLLGTCLCTPVLSRAAASLQCKLCAVVHSITAASSSAT
jgi:hypothetical protein